MYFGFIVSKSTFTLSGYDELVEAVEDPAIKGLFVPLEGVENTGPIAGFAERSTRTGNLRSSDRTTSR